MVSIVRALSTTLRLNALLPTTNQQDPFPGVPERGIFNLLFALFVGDFIRFAGA
jgi:hypothetical protein